MTINRRYDISRKICVFTNYQIKSIKSFISEIYIPYIKIQVLKNRNKINTYFEKCGTKCYRVILSVIAVSIMVFKHSIMNVGR